MFQAWKSQFCFFLKKNLNLAEATFEEIIGAVEDISFDANIKSLVENALVFFDKKMINRGALSNSVKVLLLKFWASMLDREKSDKKLESNLFKVEVCLFLLSRMITIALMHSSIHNFLQD